MFKKTKKKPGKLDLAKEEFLNQTREAFAFLVRDFGFQEEPIPLAENKYLNQFAVWYATSTTRIVVEGINWGTNTRVALGQAGPVSKFENYDFGDLLAVRDAAAEQAKRSVSGEQLEQLRQYAALLPEVAADVLRGDHSIFAELAACVERRRAEARRNEPPSMNEVAEANRTLGRSYQLAGDNKAALKHYELALSTFLEINQAMSFLKMKDTTETDDLTTKIGELKDLISKLKNNEQG